MVKIACLFGLLVLISANSVALSPADAAAFTKGFLNGLQVDPTVTSKCETDMQLVLSGSSQLIDDITDLINGKSGAFNKLVIDAQALVQKYEPLGADCNLGQLASSLEKIMGPDGYSIMMKNYFKNIQQVTDAIEGYSTCGDDHESCGKFAGEIFRYLVGFSLQTPLTGSFMSNGYGELFLGFLKGLQNDPNVDSQCVDDVSQFSGKLEIVGGDLEKILTGNTAAIFTLINDLKKLQDDIPNFFEECNIVGLIDQIEVLSGPNGFITLLNNYNKNKEAITANLKVTENCEADYDACGVALGHVVKLLVGWSIN